MLGAPPSCAPARVIPGRTLLGVKVGLAPIPSLNFKVRRLALSDACLEVPVSVLLQRCMHAACGLSDQRFLNTGVLLGLGLKELLNKGDGSAEPPGWTRKRDQCRSGVGRH